MFSEWTYWLSSISPDNLLWLILPLIAFDGVRYSLLALAIWLFDGVATLCGKQTAAHSSQTYRPSVSLLIAGLNEGECLSTTLEALWGSYPRLQIIVVDDGSTDNMSAVARHFAHSHVDVTVVSKSRGGKSSAMNAGLAYATGEVTIILDADSVLSRGAIEKIIQPLADPNVGAVSGNVCVRNASANLLTRIQAFEYLRSVFLGRIVSSKLGILGIVSGAFGAFRTSLLRQMGGWDVGPGEDEDIVLRIRKLGLGIEFVRDAECFTDVPQSLKVLTKQRRRWEWAVITFASRKHIDMANPMNKHFRVANLFMFAERWLFNLLLPLWFWVYVGWIFYNYELSQLIYPAILFYLLYVLVDVVQYLIILSYSSHMARDAQTILVIPLMPFYQFYQRIITSVALIEEIFTRRSYRDNFVPQHVRNITWHW